MYFIDLLEPALEEEDQSPLFLPKERLWGRVVVADHVATLLVSDILHEEGSLGVDLALVKWSFNEDTRE